MAVVYEGLEKFGEELWMMSSRSIAEGDNIRKIDANIYIYIYIYMCVCVCVCDWCFTATFEHMAG